MPGRPNAKGKKLERRLASQRRLRETTRQVTRELDPLVVPPARHDPTPDDILQVLNAIAEGRTLKGKCRELGVHEATVRMRIGKDPELERLYVMARQAQAHAFAETNLEDLDKLDQINAAADGASVELGIAKLKFEVRRWTMGKYHVGAYGDKLEVKQEVTVHPLRDVDPKGEPGEAASEFAEVIKQLPRPNGA